MSGSDDSVSEITVGDFGVGMDDRAVTDYLLQVAKSYYQSAEFRREFSFHPSSRFGIGFLSVFAVSQHVEVETLKAGPTAGPSIVLTLRGPRNFLLVRTGTRSVAGTRVTVRLDRLLPQGDVQRYLVDVCRMLEFPVIVQDGPETVTIVSERAEDFTAVEPVLDTPESTFEVRGFPVTSTDLQGNLFVFSLKGPEGERWDSFRWATGTYQESHPGARVPAVPPDLCCVDGLAVEAGSYPRPVGRVCGADWL